MIVSNGLRTQLASRMRGWRFSGLGSESWSEEGPQELLARLFFLLFLILGIGGLLLIPLMLLGDSYSALFEGTGLWGLLIADSWEPLAQPPKFGVRHAWLSTVAVTSIAVLIAAPAGFGMGVFIAELAPAAIRKLLQPCLELLAGIPSVVYGFFGYVTLVPWFEQTFEMSTGESLLAAEFILAVMILSFIASTSAEAFGAVPRDVKEAALALGVNRWCLVRRVLARHASSACLPPSCSGSPAPWGKRWRS